MHHITTLRTRLAALLIERRGAWLLVNGRAQQVPVEIAERVLELARLVERAEAQP